MGKKGWYGERFVMIIMALLITGFLCLMIGSATAQDVKEMAKEATKEIRNSQRRMFNGKHEEAKVHLDKAEELIKKIEAEDPDFKGLVILKSKFEKQKKDLEKRMPKKEEEKEESKEEGDKSKEEESESSEGKKSDVQKEESAKLPGGVTFRLKKVDDILKRAERHLKKDPADMNDYTVKSLEAAVKDAEGMMKEMMDGYGDQIPEGNEEVKAAWDKIEEFKKKVTGVSDHVENKEAAAADAEAARKKQSDEWLAKINPYIMNPANPGYDKDKYLIAGATDQTDELQRRKKIFDEAVILYAEYEKTEFPDGITDELERAARELKYSIDSFESSYAEAGKRFLETAQNEVEQLEQWVAGQKSKMASDEKYQPLVIGKDRIPGIKKMIEKAKSSESADAVAVADLEKRIAVLEKDDGELRTIRTERTFMIPDKFDGSEKKKIKSVAEDILKKEHPGAKPLRATVISQGWKEERVTEFTDTTQTALRHRVTQSVTAQVAAEKDGKTSLYTIHVAQDQKSGGGWGDYYGNVMFIDPMLKKNVKK